MSTRRGFSRSTSLLVFALLLASGRAQAASEIVALDGHDVLRVDGLPTLNLSVDLQESKSDLPGGSCAEITIDSYLDSAVEVGANAIGLRLRWKHWADHPVGQPLFTSFQPLSPDGDQMRAVLDGAWARGLRVNLFWMGSNVLGSAAFPPLALDDDEVTGTFHPSGDFDPNDPQYADEECGPTEDLRSCPVHSLVTDDLGAVAANPNSGTGGVAGAYCPDWPNTLEAEKVALVDLVTWLSMNRPAGTPTETTYLDTVITLNLQNEIFMGSKAFAHSTDRCRCDISDHFFSTANHYEVQQGFESFPSFGEYLDERGLSSPDFPAGTSDEEKYNQFTLQRYVSLLSDAVHAVPGAEELPIVLNVAGEPEGSPPAGSPAADLEGWVHYGEVDVLGPDMYGFEKDVYASGYDVAGNFLYAPEFGAQDYAAFQIFGILGSNLAAGGEKYVGMGYGTHALYGDAVHEPSGFAGMISDGCVDPDAGTLIQPVGTWFTDESDCVGWPICTDNSADHWGFYHRASFAALRDAGSLLAARQAEVAADEVNLVAFFDQIYRPNPNDNFQNAEATLMGQADGLTIELIDREIAGSPARGAVARLAPRDYTVVGVSFDVEISGAAEDLADLKVERGYWDGSSWIALDVATYTPGATLIRIPMDADNLMDSGALVRNEDLHDCSQLSCQYVVRVYPDSLLFSDDFESGDWTSWTSKSGSSTAVTGTAALTEGYGLEVTKENEVNPPNQYLEYEYPMGSTSSEYYGSFLLDLNGYPEQNVAKKNFRQEIVKVLGPNPGGAQCNPNVSTTGTARVWLYMTGGQGQNPNVQLWGRGNDCGERATKRIPIDPTSPDGVVRVCFFVTLGGGQTGELGLMVRQDGSECPDFFDPNEGDPTAGLENEKHAWWTNSISNGLLGFDEVRVGFPRMHVDNGNPPIQDWGTLYFDEFESYSRRPPDLILEPNPGP